MKVKAKILIVDDEQLNLDFFNVMLSKLGFEVEKAEDGEEALEKVRTFFPDLIILDNIMPKLSGWEVTKTLKNHEDFSDFRGIPIIMFSAMDDVKDKIEGFELGVEDYITKPFNFSEVLARIKAVLRHKDLSDQVVQRERRIALIESLNKSLVYFTRHLRQPMLELMNRTGGIDPDDARSVKDFVSRVKAESESTLAALDGLEDEIRELQNREDLLKKGELSLEDLEEKYQKHFNTWRERQESLRGADN
jgi:DNA-binding response OmpR family regulator